MNILLSALHYFEELIIILPLSVYCGAIWKDLNSGQNLIAQMCHKQDKACNVCNVNKQIMAIVIFVEYYFYKMVIWLSRQINSHILALYRSSLRVAFMLEK